MRALKLQINGIVQGVGFRPFVYNLAKKYSLFGYVLNSGEGVEIEIEGESKLIELFLDELHSAPPPLAKIDSIKKVDLSPKGYKNFEIKHSKSSSKSTLISPDIAICDDCLRELRDKNNRRFGYPLINCTNCGPRYTIIKELPYDRKNTSMAEFKMCKECEAEYKDPSNRRYHAQPISCFDCGPKLSLELDGKLLKLSQQEIIQKTALLLNEGKILAIKGLGGFHLVCDATNLVAVKNLRERKKRPSKPFAVMVSSIKEAKYLAKISKKEESLLCSNIRPITLLDSLKNSKLSPLVAPNLNIVGVMLPYTPIHYLLFEHIQKPLIMTSANISGEPIITSKDEIISKLGSVVDGVLDFDRDIVNGCDDSVAMVVEGERFFLRVARGLAPVATTLKRKSTKKILSLGANQKSTISIAFNDKIITSVHIGDLESIDSISFFEKNISILERFYQFEPEVLISDLHPSYHSTLWAKKSPLPHYQIQHHFAHTLAVMAENGIEEEILSFVWDGTGFGSDGSIWGGEILLVNPKDFKRVGQLREFKLLGGEMAVKEPRRVALGLLFEIFSLKEILELNSPTVKAFKEFEIKALFKAWESGLNSPLTSSIGRFFDGVASLAGVAQKITYEGESGMKLESYYQDGLDSKAKLKVENGVIEWREFVREVIFMSKEEIATALIEALVEVVDYFTKAYPNKRVVICGGVWQNRTLLKRVLQTLPKNRLILPKQLPLNDGAISLGQAYWGSCNFRL